MHVQVYVIVTGGWGVVLSILREVRGSIFKGKPRERTLDILMH